MQKATIKYFNPDWSYRHAFSKELVNRLGIIICESYSQYSAFSFRQFLDGTVIAYKINGDISLTKGLSDDYNTFDFSVACSMIVITN